MDGTSAPFAVHRIDRLIIEEDRIMIIDYKSDADVPRTLKGVKPSYRDQLRRYRDRMQVLYPDRRCEGYLLWTSTACLMKVC